MKDVALQQANIFFLLMKMDQAISGTSAATGDGASLKLAFLLLKSYSLDNRQTNFTTLGPSSHLKGPKTVFIVFLGVVGGSEQIFHS